ncbi:unnamed protein product, partial [Prorocentrum cordatum]
PRVVERARPSWMSRSRRGLSSRRRADLGPPEQGAAEDLPVAEVLSRLLAQAGADDQHAPRRCASQPASGGPRGPCGRERPPAGPGAPADAAAAAEPDGFEGAPSAADVERMRARVEERAAQLQRDLGELAERRRALLRAGTESWLRREAEESLALHEARLREEAGAAAQEVRAAAAAARADLEAVVSEIDGHLAVLGAVGASLEQRRLERLALEERCAAAVAAWAARARGAERERLARRAAAGARLARERVAALCEGGWPEEGGTSAALAAE